MRIDHCYTLHKVLKFNGNEQVNCGNLYYDAMYHLEVVARVYREDTGVMFLRNNGKHLQHYRAP
jgi:hypothetical protein